MKIRFDEYNAYTEDDIRQVTERGILLKDGFYIDFVECASNFHRIHGGSGKCVGERDLSGTNPSFGFYTAPISTHIFFMPQGKLREFFSKMPAARRFQALRCQIEQYGFTTYDRS